MDSLNQNVLQIPSSLFAGIIFMTIFVLNWAGYRWRIRLNMLYPDKDIRLGPAEGSLLGLMALLLAFSFGMANSKFEYRRQLIVDEANFINTAILRCKLYPDSLKQLLMPDLKQYVESRIAYYAVGDSPGEQKEKVTLDSTNRHFNNLWNKTFLLIRDKESRTLADQMIPALINMKNIVATREAARRSSLPLLISVVLLLLVFVSSFLMGFGINPGYRNRVASYAFALMTTATLFLVMELVRPRQGFINLENAQQNMVDLRQMFQ